MARKCPCCAGQLAQRASQQGQEAAELQRRHREMSPARKAALEKKLAALEENPNEVGDADVWLRVADVALSIVSALPFP